MKNIKSCNHIIEKDAYCYNPSEGANNLLLTWKTKIRWEVLIPPFQNDLP